MTENLTTVIMAAGKGTRMKSDLPKVLHPIQGKPMIYRVIEAARTIHSTHIITILGHQADLVWNALGQPELIRVDQVPQLGTGHAIQCTKDVLKHFEGDILVLSGDSPLITVETLQKLIDFHRTGGYGATILTNVVENPHGYGRIIRDTETNDVMGVVEQKDIRMRSMAAVREVNTGFYVFQAKPLFEALAKVKNENSQGEYYLPDVIPLMIEMGLPIGAIQARYEWETYGINTREQLIEAEILIANTL